MNSFNNIDFSIKEDQDFENNFYDNLPSLLPLDLNKTPSFTTWCNMKLTPIAITSDDQDLSPRSQSSITNSSSCNNNLTATATTGDIKNMDQIIRTIKTEIRQKNYLFEAFYNNQDMINFSPITPNIEETTTNNNNQYLQQYSPSQQQQNCSLQSPQFSNQYQQQNLVKNYQLQQQIEEINCGFSSNSLVKQISQQMQQIQQKQLSPQRSHSNSTYQQEERKIQNFNSFTDLTMQQKMLLQNQYEIQNVNQQIVSNLNEQVNSMLLGQKRPRRKSTEKRKNYCEQDSIDEQESTQDEKQEKRVPCNCKKSKCLKLYCECFAAGLMCMKECNCCECNNLEQFAKKRDIAINILLEKNPNAFMTKITKPSIFYQSIKNQLQIQNQSNQQNQQQQQLDSQSECNSGTGTSSSEAEQHIKGCNCKKSHCLKKYCECYNGGVKCSSMCKCEGCKNGNSESDNEEEEDQMSDFNEDEIEDGYNSKPRKYVKKNQQQKYQNNEQQFQQLEQNMKSLREKFQNGQFIQSFHTQTTVN